MKWLRGTTDAETHFEEPGEYVPETLPEPDEFLREHEILTDERHLAVHEMVRDCFEEFGIYDMTFGYNLAKLNRDKRHPGAGFRYATPTNDAQELLATFTPTTEFCPQGDSLAVGAFRALNRSDHHDYDIVRVRVHQIHHHSETINARIRSMEETFLDSGHIPEGPAP